MFRAVFRGSILFSLSHPVFLLSLMLLLYGCSSDDGGSVSPPPASPGPLTEKKTIEGLARDVYRTAMQQEDIDRLDALLDIRSTGSPVPQSTAVSPSNTLCPQQQDATCPQDEGERMPAQCFLGFRSTDFCTFNLLAHDVLQDSLDVAEDHQSITFLEVESVEDAATLTQRTRLFRTTFWVTTTDEGQGKVVQKVQEAQRKTLVEASITGQVQARALTRLEVYLYEEPWQVTTVEIELPDPPVIPLSAAGKRFHGLFRAPESTKLHTMLVRLRGRNNQSLAFPHVYQPRFPNANVVQRIAGTESANLLTVAASANGAVWAGGDRGGSLYYVPPATTKACFFGHLTKAPQGRVTAIVPDTLGRLHFLFFSPQSSGDVVLAADALATDGSCPDIRRTQDLFCQTVDAFATHYPFVDETIQTGARLPSASTRALAARNTPGELWLFGSSNGVARVNDTFRGSRCQPEEVQYHDHIVQQTAKDEGLPSNIVTAMVESSDGVSQWFGTLFGLVQRQNGQFLRPREEPQRDRLALEERRRQAIQQNNGPGQPPKQVTTYEELVQQVAQAIFLAQPVRASKFGDVSFQKLFGATLSKEDLIFSMVEDAERRLWVGTLGGGLWRFQEGQDARQFTRQQDGLGSNIIFALATGPEPHTVWAATDEGVSRIQDSNGTVTITNFSALDGLASPVRDIIVQDKTLWAATAQGLFRLLPQGHELRGRVVNPAGAPVAGATVRVSGTPLQAVTDTQGHFQLAGLPPGVQRLLVTKHLDASGPEVSTCYSQTVGGQSPSADVTLVLGQTRVPHRLVPVAGTAQERVVGTQLAIVAEVRDAQDQPVTDVSVQFEVSGPDGFLPAQVHPVQTSTETTCQAATTLTLATTAGENRVKAKTDRLETAFIVQGIADQAQARLIQVSGNNQVAAPGKRLSDPLVVRLVDPFNNPIAGAEVKAQITVGDAKISSAEDVITMSDGKAAFDVQLGPQAEVVIVAMQALSQEVNFVALTLVTVVGRHYGGIAVEKSGHLVVIDTSRQAVLRVDPETGTTTLVSGDGRGQGPPFLEPRDIAVRDNGSLVVLDKNRLAVVQVDPVTGDRTILSGCDGEVSAEAPSARPRCKEGTNDGNPLLFIDPTSLAVEDQDKLVVADGGCQAVIRIDLAPGQNGKRTVVSGCSDCRLDPTTLQCQSSLQGGSQQPLEFPNDIVVDKERKKLFIADPILKAIIKIDPDSGERIVVSGCRDLDCNEGPVGMGPINNFVPLSLAMNPVDNNIVVVHMRPPAAVIAVDHQQSGQRTLVTDCREALPKFAPLAIAVTPTAAFVLHLDAQAKKMALSHMQVNIPTQTCKVLGVPEDDVSLTGNTWRFRSILYGK